MRKNIGLFCDGAVALLAGTGTAMMLGKYQKRGALATKGLKNFKYYTVLSNEFCGLIAIFSLVFHAMDRLKGRRVLRKWMVLLKLMATAMVCVTFLVTIIYLAPTIGFFKCYRGWNLIFHLFLPIIAVAGFAKTDLQGYKITRKDGAISAIPTMIYGNFYLGNILINGMGEHRKKHDWYGFTAWGIPFGMVMFGLLLGVNMGIAEFLSRLNAKFSVTADKSKTRSEAEKTCTA